MKEMKLITMPVSHPELYRHKEEQTQDTKPHWVVKNREKLKHTWGRLCLFHHNCVARHVMVIHAKVNWEFSCRWGFYCPNSYICSPKTTQFSIFVLIKKCIFLYLPVDQLCYQTIPATIFIHSTIVINNIEFIINTKIYINNEYSGLFKLGYLPKTTNNWKHHINAVSLVRL